MPIHVSLTRLGFFDLLFALKKNVPSIRYAANNIAGHTAPPGPGASKRAPVHFWDPDAILLRFGSSSIDALKRIMQHYIENQKMPE